jgi:Dopey, N-terminal
LSAEKRNQVGIVDRKHGISTARMASNNQRDVQHGTKGATSLARAVQGRGWYDCYECWPTHLMHTRTKALAQQAYASDPKYKKYTQQVDRCLSTFDNVHEWADFIAFLKQLLKVRNSTRVSFTRFG